MFPITITPLLRALMCVRSMKEAAFSEFTTVIRISVASTELHCYIGDIFLYPRCFLFLYPRLTGQLHSGALMTFECEGRAIQLRNLDTILSCTWVTRKAPPPSAAYSCCYPFPTAGQTRLSRPIWFTSGHLCDR